MNTLHNIPREYTFKITESEKNAMRWLHYIGYTRFKPVGQGRWDLYGGTGELLLRNHYITIYDNESRDPNSYPPFEPEWIIT